MAVTDQRGRNVAPVPQSLRRYSASSVQVLSAPTVIANGPALSGTVSVWAPISVTSSPC